MDKHRDAPVPRYQHVSYVDERMQLVDTLRDGKMNCVVALMQACDRLRNYREMDDSLVRLNLMYVIHIAGDMHCRDMVSGCKSGRAVCSTARKMSYHAVWDWGVLDRAHGWSYSEYREQLDTHTKRERRAMAAGTPRDWVHETAVDCRVIYDWQRPDGVYDNAFGTGYLHAARTALVKTTIVWQPCLIRFLNSMGRVPLRSANKILNLTGWGAKYILEEPSEIQVNNSSTNDRSGGNDLDWFLAARSFVCIRPFQNFPDFCISRLIFASDILA